jgi:hypothetical protein
MIDNKNHQLFAQEYTNNYNKNKYIFATFQNFTEKYENMELATS